VCALLLNPSLGDLEREYSVQSTRVFDNFPSADRHDMILLNASPRKSFGNESQTVTPSKVFGVPVGGNFGDSADRTWNPTMAQLWLRTYIQDLGSFCNQWNPEVEDMALIDCHTMTLVKAPESTRWVALSYVWGETHPGSSSESSLPTSIPKTVEDAITVTKVLGYRYLWVDQYCIYQTNLEKRHSQIRNMHKIYRNADLTIVAVAGEKATHGLPGVSTTVQKRIKTVSLGDITLLPNFYELELTIATPQ
jgi:hypothetical protein